MIATLALVTALAVIALFFFMLARGSAGTLRMPLRDRLALMRALGPEAGVVTLAQAKLNATDDIDVAVIDEFQKSSWLLENLQFDDVVNQAGAGSTLTYGYQRLVTQATAGYRAINSEYVPQEVSKQRFTVDLKVLGGSFQIDRVLNGIAAAAETTLQMQQKVKAALAQWNDGFVNGDTAATADSFDGMSKALVGSSTEVGVTAGTDWSSIVTGNDSAFAALDTVDELLALLDGPAAVLLGNARTLAKLRGIARRAGYWTQNQVQFDSGFLRVEQFGNVTVVDPGTKPGSNLDVIPVVSKTVGGVAGQYTDLYAVRLGLDGVHGVATSGSQLIQSWLPDFERAGAVKTGEVELGPVAVAVKATKALAVRRNIRLA